jgi:hypothetical protein
MKINFYRNRKSFVIGLGVFWVDKIIDLDFMFWSLEISWGKEL